MHYADGRLPRISEQSTMLLVGGPMDRYLVTNEYYRNCTSRGRSFTMRTVERPDFNPSMCDTNVPLTIDPIRFVENEYVIDLWINVDGRPVWVGVYSPPGEDTHDRNRREMQRVHEADDRERRYDLEQERRRGFDSYLDNLFRQSRTTR